VKFAGALTLTYNASTLILPGGANITTAAGDTAIFLSDGSGNWTCLNYTKATGKGTVAPAFADLTSQATGLAAAPFGPFTSIASATTTDLSTVTTVGVNITGTTTITSLGTGANLFRVVKFAGALSLTYNASSLILPGAATITTAAGDTMICMSDGSGNWTIVDYVRASNTPVGLNVGTSANNLVKLNGSSQLPAVDGSLLTNLPSTGGMTLLGTLTTSSGTTQTLSSLTLTNYKFVLFSVKDVACGSTVSLQIASNLNISSSTSTSKTGTGWIDLSNGACGASIASSGTVGSAGAADTGYSTATTSISFSFGGSAFTGGTITVYGVK